MNRYGVCSPSVRKDNDIGTVSEERFERRAADAVRRKAKQEEAEAINKLFDDGYKPHKGRKTKQEKLDLFLMRAYYRKLVRDGEAPDDVPPRLKWLLRRAARGRSG
jgi:hypothetical protein